MKRAGSEITTDGVAKSRAKQRVATASVIASGNIAFLELLVGALTGSLGLLAEGAHSLFDLVSNLITFLVIGMAAVPPDADHPYGHERAENLERRPNVPQFLRESGNTRVSAEPDLPDSV